MSGGRQILEEVDIAIYPLQYLGSAAGRGFHVKDALERGVGIAGQFPPANKLMAVEVKTGSKLEVTLPQPLSDARFFTGPNLGVSPYAAASGQRFLITTMQGESVSAPITIVQNWTSGVKR